MTSYNKKVLRKTMLLEKKFLSDLYKSNPLTVQEIFFNATKLQLNLTLKLLHCITRGEIPLKNETIQTITRNKTGSFLKKNFRSSVNVKKLLKDERGEKMKILCNKPLQKSYCILFERYEIISISKNLFFWQFIKQNELTVRNEKFPISFRI